MRFNSNRGWLKYIGFSALLILSTFYISALAPVKIANAVMSNCIVTPPSSTGSGGGTVGPATAGPVVATINITPAGGTYDPLSIVLKSDSDNIKQTVPTCKDSISGTIQATFPKVDKGKYKVCYKNTCSTIFEKINTDDTTPVTLAVTQNEAASVGGSVYVDVKVNFDKSTTETTYGGFTITLESLASALTMPPAATSTQTVPANKNGPITVTAQFANVTPGYTKACIDGLNLCAGADKLSGRNITITIDVPKDKAVSLIAPSGSSSTKTCGSEVTGLGWIMCPIINGLTGLNDTMWRLVSSLLTVNPLNQSDPIYQAWGTIRSIANVLFAIFFLIIIFSQLSSVGIDNYGIKKLLPRLIVSAVLVNISFVIVQVSVDLANIIGSSLYGLLTSITLGYIPSWARTIEIILNGTGLAVAGTFIVFGSSSAFWLLFPMMLMGLLGLLAAVLTLIFRQAIIPVLAILAPLAFVAYMLPNTEQWFKKWRDMLMTMLMMYPVAALIFGGSKFAASVIVASHEDEYWANLIGMIVLAAPLFSLPFLVKQGGPILSKVGGALSKLAETARKPLTNWSKGHQDEAKSRYLAENANERNSGNRRFAGARLARNLNKDREDRRRTRENATKGYQSEADEDYRERALKANPNSNKYVDKRAVRAKEAIERMEDQQHRGETTSGGFNKNLEERKADKNSVVGKRELERRAYGQAVESAKGTQTKNYGEALAIKDGDIIKIAAGNVDPEGSIKAQAYGVQALTQLEEKNVTAAQVLGGNTSEAAYQAGMRMVNATDATTGTVVRKIQVPVVDQVTGAVTYSSDDAVVGAFIKDNKLGAGIESFSDATYKSLDNVQSYAKTPFGVRAIAQTLAGTGQLTANGIEKMITDLPPETTAEERGIVIAAINASANAAGLKHLGTNSQDRDGKFVLAGLKGGVDKLVSGTIANYGIAGFTKDMMDDPAFGPEAARQAREQMLSDPNTFNESLPGVSAKVLQQLAETMTIAELGTPLPTDDVAKAAAIAPILDELKARKTKAIQARSATP